MRIERRRRARVRWTGIILLALVMVLGLAAGALAFTDVHGNPYTTAINELASRQIVNGFGDLFKPVDPVKRQQFAKMIVRTLGLEVPSDAVCRFTDVDTYGGTYAASSEKKSGSSFSTGELARTLMAGQEPAMRAEHLFLQLLAQTRIYSLADDKLTLADANGNQLLIFDRAG